MRIPILITDFSFLIVPLETSVLLLGGGVLLLGMASGYLFGYFQSSRWRKKLRIAQQQNSYFRLQALQAQLHPHLVFNALADTQYLINERNFLTARKFVQQLAKLLRAFLNASVSGDFFFKDQDGTVSLAEEINLLRAYVEFEGLKHPFPLTLRLTIAKNIDPQQIRVPTLITQVFIENAVKHGLQLQRQEGVICVDFSRRAAKIICTIQDNGSEHDDKKLSQQPFPFQRAYGLQLVRERIKTLHKLGYNIGLKSEQSATHGTKVTLSFPTTSLLKQK